MHTRMYNLLGNRKMLPVPYGPVGSIGLAVLCGATVVGDRLHVAVRYSTKKCQCVMQDSRVLAQVGACSKRLVWGATWHLGSNLPNNKLSSEVSGFLIRECSKHLV